MQLSQVSRGFLVSKQYKQGRSSHRLHASSLTVVENGTMVGNKQQLVQDAIVWASQHGLLYRLGGDSIDAATIHAPMSLLPCPMPTKEFNKAKDLMPILSTLVDEISKDDEYLLAQAFSLSPRRHKK
eukprot:TRINITY_DN72270_c0_g1_i1.p1 TRINITY_DN72270_c0_g1~~TRINITY_DN72270_c0_g1_i1.p1  ORF type:complete len:127 (-),score=4.76 TRINITY_DN72270_c0_g1_i1:30-410(-)